MTRKHKVRVGERFVTVPEWEEMLRTQAAVWMPVEIDDRPTPALGVLASLFVGLVFGYLTYDELSAPYEAALIAGLVVFTFSTFVSFWFLNLRQPALPSWLVDFESKSLLPTREPNQQSITLCSDDFSVGCYLATGKDGRGQACLLELRHPRRGPIAELARVRVPNFNFQADLADFDRCVDVLVTRLGVRRSGASLAAK